MAPLGLTQSRRNTVGSFTFQAAASGAVTTRQTAKRSAISIRHSAALSRCRRGRKCAEMPLKADRNRCACRDDLKRFTPFALSGGLMRVLVGDLVAGQLVGHQHPRP